MKLNSLYLALKKSILLVAGSALLTTHCFAGPEKPDYNKVPQPILEEHPGWVDLYKRAFEISFSKIQKGTPENGFVEYYMDEAFSANIFQWDTSFIMMFARYGNGELPAIVSLENFYRQQDEDGWIGREFREADASSYWPKEGGIKANCSINPPLFSWAEWQDYQVSGDLSRFTKLINGKELLQVLVDYYDWIKAERRWSNDLYWTTSYANGMDRSSRLNPGIKNDVCDHAEGSWIDITAQQALNAFYIAKIAGALGRTKLQQRMLEEHKEIAELINEQMWDEKDGFYYDLDKDGEFYKVKTPASLWTLIARVTDEEKAKRLVDEHVTNPAVFKTEHHMPTVSKDDPTYHADGGYWDGAVWAPTTYQALKGLEVQGYTKEARELAMNHIQNLYWVYKDSNTLYENYRPEEQLKGPHARADFVGWTGVGPIAGLIENVLGIRANAPEDILVWDIALTEKHGIKNLKFGNNKVSLLAEDRVNQAAGTQITVKTNDPFTLQVSIAGERYDLNVVKGNNKFVLGRPSINLVSQGTQHNSRKQSQFGTSKNEVLRFQTFKAMTSGKLLGVDVKIQKINGHEQSDLKLALHLAKNGQPYGEALSRVNVAAESIDNFVSIVQADLKYRKIKQGKEYALVLSQTKPQQQAYAWIDGENVDGQGNSGYGDENGRWLQQPDKGDAWFKAYYTDLNKRISDVDRDGIVDAKDKCLKSSKRIKKLLDGCKVK